MLSFLFSFAAFRHFLCSMVATFLQTLDYLPLSSMLWQCDLECMISAMRYMHHLDSHMAGTFMYLLEFSSLLPIYGVVLPAVFLFFLGKFYLKDSFYVRNCC